MKYLKISLVLFAFLLVLNLSTGTVKACSPPTSVDRSANNDGSLCFGNGAVGDYPAGENATSDDPNCSTGVYGTTCYTCQGNYVADTSNICRDYSFCTPYTTEDEEAFIYATEYYWSEGQIASTFGCEWSGTYYP